MSVSDKLKSLRLEQGLSQAELAEKIGLSMHSINSYESGRREPNSKAMAALEQYFGVTGSYLRGEEATFNEGLKKIQDATQKALDMSSVFTSVSALTNASSELLQQNCQSMLQAFAELSEASQQEIMKRIQERKELEDLRRINQSSSKKNSPSEDDPGATIHIAARDGTRITKTISTELRDEIRNLPPEDYDL